VKLPLQIGRLTSRLGESGHSRYARRMERNLADETKLNQFMGKILGDLGGAFSVPMVHGRHRRSERRCDVHRYVTAVFKAPTNTQIRGG
jgi:hypothetical protein